MFMLLRVNLIRYIDNQLGDLSSYTVFFFLRLITPVIKLKLELIMKKPTGTNPVIFIPIIQRTLSARTFRAGRC
jgi:hypothetical protein